MLLRWRCEYRISVDAMDHHATAIIDALGGTTKVADLIKAPTSTVQSWKKIGIPPSRLEHLKLIAKVEKIDLPADAA